MKEIILACGTLTQVDDQFYEELNQYKWCLALKGKYVSRSIYTPETQLSSAHLMHWDVAELGKLIIPHGYEIDHVDRNKINNQLANLRVVTRSQNNFNHDIQSNNTSGCKGVSFDSRRNKWRVVLKLNGTQRCLGFYKDFNDAVVARLQGEIDYGVAEYCRSG